MLHYITLQNPQRMSLIKAKLHKAIFYSLLLYIGIIFHSLYSNDIQACYLLVYDRNGTNGVDELAKGTHSSREEEGIQSFSTHTVQLLSAEGTKSIGISFTNPSLFLCFSVSDQISSKHKTSVRFIQSNKHFNIKVNNEEAVSH